jgi:hypothetical protein
VRHARELHAALVEKDTAEAEKSAKAGGDGLRKHAALHTIFLHTVLADRFLDQLELKAQFDPFHPALQPEHQVRPLSFFLSFVAHLRT